MVRVRLTSSLLFLACSAAFVAAQDPLTTLPDFYKVQFENEWVRVVRVHYDAGAKLAEHTHPLGTTAYVYLNDSDGVIFKHSGSSSRATTRPPVKAGSFTVASGQDETHTADNTGATPSDFLRIQFKSDTKGVRTPRRRIARGTYPAGEVVADVQFTNAQMRVTRIIVPPGKSSDVVAAATEPAVLISLPLGEERWIGLNQRETLSNSGTAPMEFLRFDFLTPPAK